MPLSNKTILDSHCFVHELKTEMHDDLEYVKSLEKEVDELESEKADFSNIYDLLLEELDSHRKVYSTLSTGKVTVNHASPDSCMQTNSGFKCRNQCQNGFTKDEIFTMTFEHSSSSLGRQCQMASAENNTSGPVLNVQKSFLAADQASDLS
ncbi:hypothetical protein Tco_1417868 [Tanacetum coccineum]